MRCMLFRGLEGVDLFGGRRDNGWGGHFSSSHTAAVGGWAADDLGGLAGDVRGAATTSTRHASLGRTGHPNENCGARVGSQVRRDAASAR